MKEKIDKIKKTLKKAEKIAENLESPLNLAFSGGKDSVVLKFFADEAGVNYEANFCNTGIEIYTGMPHFIRDNYPDVNIIHPKRDKSFFPLMQKHGYPTLFRRWCCEYLKHNNEAMKDYKVNLTGVRGAESRKRLERGAISVFGNTKRAEKRKYLLREFIEKDTEIQCIGGREKININAIFDLTDDEVWDIIRTENLILPPIYNTHKRAGCAFCPFASPKENYETIKQRPNLAKAWLKTIKSPQFKETQKNLIRFDEVEQFYLYINGKMLYKEEIKKAERYLREPDLFGITGRDKFIEYLKKCKAIK